MSLAPAGCPDPPNWDRVSSLARCVNSGFRGASETVGLTPGPGCAHPRGVVKLVYRLSALALSLALIAANGAVCAGWALTPEARMACCFESTCPMHKGESQGSNSERSISQVQADSCCASSEHRKSSESSPTFVAAVPSAVLGAGVVLPAVAPALVLSDGWRTVAPIPTAHVPKHVLLSVFLV